jgi:hypothetical protein
MADTLPHLTACLGDADLILLEISAEEHPAAS